jgi:hypothetical protein
MKYVLIGDDLFYRTLEGLLLKCLGPIESLQLWHSYVELSLEVPTLDGEPVHARPLDGDAGILSHVCS